jgi:predicted TIM-barrel fold metal-dependent hydrolase
MLRREVLSALSAAGVCALFPDRKARGQVTNAGARIIDTHHHIYPPHFVKVNLDRLLRDAPGFPAAIYQQWSPHSALEQMDKANVAVAIASITSPGIWFNDGVKAGARARECNEFGARLTHDYVGRFGMFAAVPLPDTDGCLTEIAYALDVLKLDGVGLFTSYGGKLLGDPAFGDVFQELNRRAVTVFVHPTMSCCGNIFPELPGPVIEFPTDTARAIASLLFRGTFASYPHIKFIFSHGGGTLPSIVQRFTERVESLTAEERAIKLPNGLENEINRQYYDLASILGNPAGMAAVLKLLPASQLTYGSDVPFGSMIQNTEALARLGLSTSDLRAIEYGNAARLFPRRFS